MHIPAPRSIVQYVVVTCAGSVHTWDVYDDFFFALTLPPSPLTAQDATYNVTRLIQCVKPCHKIKSCNSYVWICCDNIGFTCPFSPIAVPIIVVTHIVAATNTNVDADDADDEAF